jgi:two-component system response regulator MprA
MVNVGICEDDDELRDVVREALQRAGMAVRPTASGREAVTAFAERPPDVLVLDIGLPDADGRDVCRALRSQGIAVPVLFLTALDAVPDRISGFKAGGDDYLAKPFELAELVVRVRALVRRSTGAAERRTAFGVGLDHAAHALVFEGRRVQLTPTEFRLVAALVARAGAPVRRAALIAAGWPDGAMVRDTTLDAYLARIRRKLRLAGASEAIQTVRGVGYVLR